MCRVYTIFKLNTKEVQVMIEQVCLAMTKFMGVIKQL